MDSTPPAQERDPALDAKIQIALQSTIDILQQRCQDKLAYLQQLREEATKKRHERTKPYTPEEQPLAILRAEEARLHAEIARLHKDKETEQPVLPELMRLRVREMIKDTIDQYREAIPQLQAELEETQQELAVERQTLQESTEIKQALEERLVDLERIIESEASQESSQGRQRLAEARRRVQFLMQELTKFIETHYPPSSSNPRERTLKIILEDLMNLSVQNTVDPYLSLRPGEYYPPDVERLIVAGIAVRHPRDAQKLRLVDFYS
ncbi:hypothetical protein BGZ73_002872 [Actinomortierella ambigua]|nr:hypothetical protein BGZ73_002872 [Actinomortierella ambigua]